jgi:hypothetical protein
MSTGILIHPQPQDAACSGDRDPLNMEIMLQVVKTAMAGIWIDSVQRKFNAGLCTYYDNYIRQKFNAKFIMLYNVLCTLQLGFWKILEGLCGW